jgi:polyisoprenyl-phosphate glycosyltransferase
MAHSQESLMLSVIIPVFNEEDNIRDLLKELFCVLETVESHEVIFIDDGSRDDTLELIKECATQYNNIFFISFSKNFGHQNALMAGLNACRGKAVISMDGDLQHPPSLIPQMISIWKDGYDIVCTTRLPDQSNGVIKEWTSALFYKLINYISDVNIKEGAADFRLLDRKVVEELKKIKEYDIFYRGMVAWLGFKQYDLVYTPALRKYGDTKYSFFKMLKFAISGITSFSIFPLRISALSGFVVAGLSFAYGIYAVLMKIFGAEVVTGWASIMVGLYFLGGIQLIAIGMCGEYIGKILMEVKKRPNYIVADSSMPSDEIYQ